MEESDKRPAVSDTLLFVKALHADQVDKLGNPYIEHVLVVYDALLKEGADEDTQTVGLLHDVVEDGHATLEKLRAMGYSETVVEAVDAISRRKDEETYMEYVRRAAKNPIARRVKKADVRHNFKKSQDAMVMFAGMVKRYGKALDILDEIEKQ